MHSPLPWASIYGGAYIVPAEDKGKPVGSTIRPEKYIEFARVIATVGGIRDREPLTPMETALANAALIVTAVNNHAALLKALESCEHWLSLPAVTNSDRHCVANVIKQARAAIAAAKGG